MNEAEQRHPTSRRYLRYLAMCAHDAGLPYLPIDRLSARQVSEWIAYLRFVISAHEKVEALLHETECRLKQPDSPYFVTPSRENLPASYRPAWQDLPDAFDHEHIVGTIKREDGIVESVCVVCGVSA
jgi:hypothetical protein